MTARRFLLTSALATLAACNTGDATRRSSAGDPRAADDAGLLVAFAGTDEGQDSAATRPAARLAWAAWRWPWCWWWWRSYGAGFRGLGTIDKAYAVLRIRCESRNARAMRIPYGAWQRV